MFDVFHSLSDFSWIRDSSAWVGLITLIVLEVVLGIDNIVFISILTGKLPEADREKARRKGLILAVIPRIVFLLLLGVILGMREPLFSIPWPFGTGAAAGGHGASHMKEAGKLALTGQDLVLLAGGLFLIVQAVREIHHKLEGGTEGHGKGAARGSAMTQVMIQIMFMNVIFSLDSIITAVGMVKQVPVMIIAVLVSTVIMMLTVNTVSNFVERHPTVKILALSFLLLIGTNLLAEAAHYHIPKGYVYFAMAFSVFVETINIKASARRNPHPVQLNPPA
jgi:predicted tellurium resistance membrane protein TerC